MPALSVLLLIGIACADTFGNFSIGNWESTIGSQIGTVFGSATFTFPGGITIDAGYVMMSVVIIGFFFIWSSVSGIAWDGVFFLMMIVLVILAIPQGGLLGTTAWGLFNFVFALVVMGVLYRAVLRRG